MIYGERVRLRHVERVDLPKFVEWLNNPLVTQGISMHIPISVDEEDGWMRIFSKSLLRNTRCASMQNMKMAGS